jgi:2,3-bisphosphoglycerate-independent phosphoglycerate mutase
MRQLVEVFGYGHTGKDKLGNEGSSWPPFAIKTPAPRLLVVQMTAYDEKFPFPVLFPKESMDNVLAEWIAKNGLSQYHSAETEKYAHMTFFFNGGREEPFPLETRSMVPSPKVPTYDLQPEMNAKGVAEDVVKTLESQAFPFVVCNFAPPDMVGHTGNLEAAVKAIKACDEAIGEIYDGCVKHGYVLIVTSDHGNAEVMIAPDGTRHTAHTSSPVPFVVAGYTGDLKLDGSRRGELSDVAPTILKLMNLPIPPEMTGCSLLI